MSFKIIMAGIVELFLGVILSVLVVINLIPPPIFIYTVMGLFVIFGLVMALTGILCNGIIDPFMAAKLGNKNLIQAATASGKFKFLIGKERGGMTETNVGSFITPPGSVFTYPNGVKGGIATIKYATTLTPKFIKGMTELKKQGINDIRQLMEKAKESADKGEEFKVTF